MDILIYVRKEVLRMANYQTHLESSRQLEEAFQNEAENAQNAEVKSFYQKLASEQRTITNQLQSKVNTGNTEGQVQANQARQANANQANANQANAHQANANQANAHDANARQANQANKDQKGTDNKNA
jgi:hypothetical protein